MAETIDNQNIGPVIIKMHWSSFDLSKSSIQLLTSDRPLDMPLGLGQSDAYIALPISPRFLFIAARDRRIAQTLRATDPTEIVRKNNQGVIQRARKFVWGSNDAQLKFIQRNIGKLPDREIITEQQRQAAINAARGKIGI